MVFIFLSLSQCACFQIKSDLKTRKEFFFFFGVKEKIVVVHCTEEKERKMK